MNDNLNLNFHRIIEQIEMARLSTDKKECVKIVAASKYVTSTEIKEMYEIGQRAFGENRVQDLIAKSSELKELPIEWHYIGNIQTNKIKKLIEVEPFLIQSIDNFDTAYEVDKRLKKVNKEFNALLQINSSYEESKNGIEPSRAVDEFLKIKESCKQLNLIGVMSIGALSSDFNEVKKSFELTRAIYDKLVIYGAKICSMGMSGDFDLAIRCGSNMVRLGSILFKQQG